MKAKRIVCLLIFSFLFLFSSSSFVFGDDLQDGKDAYKRKDSPPSAFLMVVLLFWSEYEYVLYLNPEMVNK